MTDKSQRYRSWLGQVAPLDAERVWQRIEARVEPAAAQSRTRRKWLVLAPLLAAGAILGYVVLSDGPAERGAPLRLADGTTPALLSSGTEAKIVALSDGSQIELARQTVLLARASTGTRFEAELQQGRAVFDVIPHGPRVWSVRAADVQVKVLGTRFSVALNGTTVEVAVERGAVQVTSPALGSARILHAHQSLQLLAATAEDLASTKPDIADDASARSNTTDAPPGDDAAAAHVAHDSAASDPVAAARARGPAGPRADRSAQARHRRAADSGGRTAAAERSRSGDPADEAREAADRDMAMEAWLERADSARAAGQPGKAASALERAVAAHPRDPRAALAAFTLAQLYMEQLAQPREAARAFERASLLGLPATLAEEAAARRVEAYARAGQHVQAHEAADAYQSKYPNGARASSVARWLTELQ